MNQDTPPTAPGPLCPVCAAFVGPLRTCPSCGARIRVRASLRVFRAVSVLLATVGLALLWAAVRRREIPLVPVGRIEPTMNFGYIRVAGTATADARVYREGDRVSSVRFRVEDGTGSLEVRAVRDRARELAEAGLVPRAGDRVEVAGSLNVSADSATLWIQAPGQMRLEREARPAPAPAALGAIRREDAGQTVWIDGRVVSVSEPPPGSRAPWRIRLRDDSGEAEVVAFAEAAGPLAGTGGLRPGARLRGPARIGEFRGAVQVVLGRGAELEAAP